MEVTKLVIARSAANVQPNRPQSVERGRVPLIQLVLGLTGAGHGAMVPTRSHVRSSYV